ncbi:MAG: hypothetical protein ACE5GY_07610 [Thermodesulfobacteriota bacterium]
MGTTVVTSFEDGAVKVVYASMKGGRVVVYDALVLKPGDLPAFLEKEKAREFVVVNCFRETWQESFIIPSTSRKYHRKIIETEIRSRCRFDDFSYIYTVSGEKLVEKRKVTEVFAFAVRNEEIDGIIDTFTSKGKTVKAIYPDIFLLSTMIDSTRKAVLCVSENGRNKTLFLMKDGRIVFVRQAHGNEPGISAPDVQNIEMTLNYCRQSLRINPGAVMLTGSLCNDFHADTVPSAPLVCLVPPYNVRAAGTVVTVALEFIIPISALNAEPYMDISPEDYRGLRLKKRALKYSTGAFAALSAVVLVYTGVAASSALMARSRLAALASGLPDIDAELAAYDAERAALEEYAPVIASLNAAGPGQVRPLLLAVSEIYTEGVTFNLISVSPRAPGLRCRIEGVIEAADLSAAQARYDRMIATVKRSKALGLSAHTLTLRDKGFFVEVDYR